MENYSCLNMAVIIVCLGEFIELCMLRWGIVSSIFIRINLKFAEDQKNSRDEERNYLF